MARSNLVNAVDVALADPVGGADPTIRVTDPGLLPPVPFYLVVDPFNQNLGREYMLATGILGDVLTVTRNLAGSESTTHDAGDITRITYVAQHLDDIFDEIDLYLPLTGGWMSGDLTIENGQSLILASTDTLNGIRFSNGQLIVDSGGAGLNISYVFGTHGIRFLDSTQEILLQVATAGIVATVPLAMGGNRITGLGVPTDPQDAATQAYVDGQDHDHATPIAVHTAIANAHHERTPDQTFLHADLTDVLADQHHAKYTDAEAVAAVGPIPPAQTFLHANLTDVSADQHHTRYTDAEAVAAVGTPWVGPYLLLTGGTMSGQLRMTLDNNHAIIFARPDTPGTEWMIGSNNNQQFLIREDGNNRILVQETNTRFYGAAIVDDSLDVASYVNIGETLSVVGNTFLEGDLFVGAPNAGGFRTIQLRREGRIGRLEADGVGFQNFVISTQSTDMPILLRPNNVGVAEFHETQVVIQPALVLGASGNFADEVSMAWGYGKTGRTFAASIYRNIWVGATGNPDPITGDIWFDTS